MKQLRRQVQKAELFKENVPEVEEVLEDTQIKCPECKDGEIIFVDLGIRIIEKCSRCTYKKAQINE